MKAIINSELPPYWQPDVNELVMHHAQRDTWLWFRQPVSILSAEQHAEVRPLLRNVEQRVKHDGLHAGGVVTYEAAPAFDPAMLCKSTADLKLPLCRFALYRECIEMPALPVMPAPPAQAEADDSFSGWEADISKERYNDCIKDIRERLQRGETYQVNFTFRLHKRLIGNPWHFFCKIAQGMPHAAWLDNGKTAIACASPELFFFREGYEIFSRPMKGTAARCGIPEEDRRTAEKLAKDPKNRAENIMITDMIRNDLGRIAEPGSVNVSRLCAVERYNSVWQMTSTVRARSNAGLDDIFAALFPCASITGAPKIQTMRIIAGLENAPRGIYCGAIGHLHPDGACRFNVAIRTAVIDKAGGVSEFGVGGGIVWDSSAADEYRECLIKARQLSPWPDFALLETMRWTRRNGWFLLPQHMQRLKTSASYFRIPLNLRRVRQTLLEAIAGAQAETLRVRLTVDRAGNPACSAVPLPEKKENFTEYSLYFAAEPINKADVFLYHKTTCRAFYDRAMQQARGNGCNDALLWNSRGRLTETCIGNLIVALDGKMVTPPVSDGLLNGTYRQRLIERERLEERSITIDDMLRARRMWLINSVRGLRRITSLRMKGKNVPLDPRE